VENLLSQEEVNSISAPKQVSVLVPIKIIYKLKFGIEILGNSEFGDNVQKDQKSVI